MTHGIRSEPVQVLLSEWSHRSRFSVVSDEVLDRYEIENFERLNVGDHDSLLNVARLKTQ